MISVGLKYIFGNHSVLCGNCSQVILSNGMTNPEACMDSQLLRTENRVYL